MCTCTPYPPITEGLAVPDPPTTELFRDAISWRLLRCVGNNARRQGSGWRWPVTSFEDTLYASSASESAMHAHMATR